MIQNQIATVTNENGLLQQKIKEQEDKFKELQEQLQQMKNENEQVKQEIKVSQENRLRNGITKRNFILRMNSF